MGLETLAAIIGEESVTIEDVYEPYLMQIGFLNRTLRGRVATKLAYKHLNLIFIHFIIIKIINFHRIFNFR